MLAPTLHVFRFKFEFYPVTLCLWSGQVKAHKNMLLGLEKDCVFCPIPPSVATNMSQLLIKMIILWSPQTQMEIVPRFHAYKCWNAALLLNSAASARSQTCNVNLVWHVCMLSSLWQVQRYLPTFYPGCLGWLQREQTVLMCRCAALIDLEMCKPIL